MAAIQGMSAPTNNDGVRRLLRAINYLQKFAPHLSEVTAPVKELLQENHEFYWDTAAQGKCFKQVKECLPQSSVLKLFNPDEAVYLQCDASQKGLGACLMQAGQPVGYASRSLTQTEQNYAQIEKKMLSIVFGVERFEQYLYGRPVKVDSDHQPLEIIFNKGILSAPKRLQRMMLRLQKFDLDIHYKKGKEMHLADTLGRAFLPDIPILTEEPEDVLLAEDRRGEAERDDTLKVLICSSFWRFRKSP